MEILDKIELKYKREAKFRTLIYAIGINNPQLRVSLIKGELGPKTIVSMKDNELGNEAFKLRVVEQQKYAMEAGRSDQIAEFRASKGAESGMYQCGKCKSKKVTMHPMQTRGADEPMTEFYTCLECGSQWKICP